MFQNNILLCGHQSGYLHLHSLSSGNCELCEQEGTPESRDTLPRQLKICKKRSLAIKNFKKLSFQLSNYSLRLVKLEKSDNYKYVQKWVGLKKECNKIFKIK